METTLIKGESLSDLREATKEFTPDHKKLTAEQVGVMVAERLGRCDQNTKVLRPYDFSTVLKWEANGLYDNRIIDALAAIYRRPSEHVRRAGASVTGTKP